MNKYARLRPDVETNDSLFIIAEVGVNHNGDLGLATELIDAARVAGASAVKFQTFSAVRLASGATPKASYQETNSPSGESHRAMLERLELSYDDHHFLKAYCDKVGITFLSTPYDVLSAQFLVEELKVPIIKTASADITDIFMHKYIASAGMDVIVSVGMASLGEVEEVFNIYDRAGGSQVTLMHCVSNYPCSDRSLNLRVIETLRSAFDCDVGFSDHSVGCEAAVLSVALGAQVIEKHITISKSLPGPDHFASATPDEFLNFCQSLRRAESMLGSRVKRIQEEEREMAAVSRKSIVLKRDFFAGEVIAESDLLLQRPGSGLKPSEIRNVVGRVVARDLMMGTLLTYDDLI